MASDSPTAPGCSQGIEPVAVSAVEAGRLLGISRAKVYELLASGQLRSFKIGRSRRVRVEDVRAFVSRLAEPAQQAAAA